MWEILAFGFLSFQFVKRSAPVFNFLGSEGGNYWDPH
jgi:hypothetical protein